MRVGDFVWHSARINEKNAEIQRFEKPKKICTRFNFLTIMPATSRGFMEVMRYGEDIDNTWTAIANARAFGGKIKEGDLFWIDGEEPNEELEATYGNGATATAVVKNVSYVNLTMHITLTRNKDKVTQ